MKMQDNNSYSLLKRIKTEQNNNPKHRQSCEKGSKSKTPTSKVTNSSNATMKNILNRLSNGRKKSHQITQKIVLNSKDDYLLNCNNHPNKNASFQAKNKMNCAYCYECAITLVKEGVKLCKLSEKSLKIRQIYEKQCEKIRQQQNIIHNSVTQYFQTEMYELTEKFITAKQNLDDSSKKVSLLIFNKPEKAKKQPQNDIKYQQIFGSLKNLIIEFTQKSQNTFRNSNHKINAVSQSNYTHYANKFGANKENIQNTNRISSQEVNEKNNSLQVYHTQRQYKKQGQKVINLTPTSVSKWRRKNRTQSIFLDATNLRIKE